MIFAIFIYFFVFRPGPGLVPYMPPLRSTLSRMNTVCWTRKVRIEQLDVDRAPQGVLHRRRGALTWMLFDQSPSTPMVLFEKKREHMYSLQGTPQAQHQKGFGRRTWHVLMHGRQHGFSISQFLIFDFVGTCYPHDAIRQVYAHLGTYVSIHLPSGLQNIRQSILSYE